MTGAAPHGWPFSALGLTGLIAGSLAVSSPSPSAASATALPSGEDIHRIGGRRGGIAPNVVVEWYVGSVWRIVAAAAGIV